MTSRRRPADNPFRVSRITTLRYRANLTGLTDRFAQLGYRAALVGPHGSGKSTLREDLCLHLTATGWTVDGVQIQLGEQRPSAARWRTIIAQTGSPRHLTWIDGAEQLSAWRWRRLRCQLTGPLLITVHKPARNLPTLHHHQVNLTLLESLCSELIGNEASTRLRTRLQELFEVHHGNLRDVFRSLYDDWASEEMPENRANERLS